MDELPGLGHYIRGDGTIASAQTHGDIAALTLQHKPQRLSDCRHGVYTLVCRNDYSTEEGLVTRAIQVNKEVPDSRLPMLKEALHAPIIFYVGQSRDVVARLYSHATGQGGFTTAVFPPRRIASIEWYTSETDSRKNERERAEELQEEHPAAYVAGGR